jgi:hypothetical protein
VLLAGGLTHHKGARAQSGASFAVSPPTFELNATPGTGASGTLLLENRTGEPRTVNVRVRDFTARGEEGQPGFSEEPTYYTLADWVSVNPKRVEIPPKFSQPFEFTVDVPLDATPGGHYAALIFRNETPLPSGDARVNVIQEIAALLLLRVPGEIDERAMIESFRAKKTSFQNGPISLEARIRNRGNVHVKPGTVITIKNLLGSPVAVLPVQAGNVLPDSARKFNTKWNRKWLWGLYSATLSVSYGSESTKRLSSRIWFFGYPILILAAIGLVLLLTPVVVYQRRRRARASEGPGPDYAGPATTRSP